MLAESNPRNSSYGHPVCIETGEFARIYLKWVRPGVTVSRHAHATPSISCLLIGECEEIFSSKNAWTRRPGLVIAAPPGDAHALHFGKARALSLVVEFRESRGISDAPSPDCLTRRRALEGHSAYFWLARLVCQLSETSAEQSRITDAVDEIASGMWSSLLERRFGERGSIPGWLRRIHETVTDPLATLPRFSRLAHEANVDPAYLARAYRKAFRRTMGEDRRRVKIDHALGLLARDECSVADAALAAGFSDQSHFGRMLKRRTGLSPDIYRKSLARLAEPTFAG
jgi:AraC family transcriptional regulator